MQIKKTRIPVGSIAESLLPADYSDAFAAMIHSIRPVTPDGLQEAFWLNPPKWIELLFSLRNAIAGLFGLKGKEDYAGLALKNCLRNGECSGMFSIAGKSPDETVLCLDDKHLKAYMSVHIKELGNNNALITLGTVVHFHYWLGRAYFFVIRPFHGLIVRGMLKHSLKEFL